MKNNKIIKSLALFSLFLGVSYSFAHNIESKAVDSEYTIYEAKDLGLPDFGTKYTFNAGGDGKVVEGSVSLSNKSELHLSYKSAKCQNYFITVGGYGVYLSNLSTLRFISLQYSPTQTTYSRAYTSDYTGSLLKSDDGVSLLDEIKGNKYFTDFVDATLKVDLTGENAVVSYSVVYNGVTYYPYKNANKITNATLTQKVKDINDTKFRVGGADASDLITFKNDTNKGEKTSLEYMNFSAEEIYKNASPQSLTEISLASDKSYVNLHCTWTSDSGKSVDPYVRFVGDLVFALSNFDSVQIEYQLEKNHSQSGNIYIFYSDSPHQSTPVTSYVYNADKYSYIDYLIPTTPSGESVTYWRYDYYTKEFDGDIRIKSFKFYNADGHWSKGLIEDPDIAKDLTNDGQFTYKLSKTVIVSGEEAPVGTSGYAFRINQGGALSLDFTKSNIELDCIESIDFKVYVDGTQDGKYPEFRIQSGISTDWLFYMGIGDEYQGGGGYSLASFIGKWVTVSLKPELMKDKDFSKLASKDNAAILGDVKIIIGSHTSTDALIIDGVSVNIRERQTFPFVQVAGGWNNTDVGTSKQTILQFGTYGVDFFGNAASSTNLSVEGKDIATRFTINGTPMYQIPGSTITYLHYYNYLYFSVPNYALSPSNGYKVTTLHIEEGTHFLNNNCGEVTLYLVDDVWKTEQPETTSDENYISLNDTFGVNEYTFGDKLDNLTTYSLPTDSLNYKFVIEHNDDQSEIKLNLYGEYISISLRTTAIDVFKDSSRIGNTKLNLIKGNRYLIEIEIDINNGVIKIGLDGLYKINITTPLEISDRTMSITGKSGAFIKNYNGSDFRGPSISFTGTLKYYFNEGTAVYDFTNIVSSYDIKDGDVTNAISYNYDEGAVINGVYQAGVWNLAIVSSDVDGNITTLNIVIVIYGGNETFIVSFDGENEISVNYGDLLTEPTQPNRDGDNYLDYVFDGWYLGDEKWDFDVDRVSQDMNLESRYKEEYRYYTISIDFIGIDKDPITLEVIYGTIIVSSIFELDGYNMTFIINGENYNYVLVSGDMNVTISYSLIETPHYHSYTFVPQVDATSEQDGVKAHYECSECHKYFILEDGEYIEVSYDSLIIKYVAPTSEIDKGSEEPSKDVTKKGCGGSIIAFSGLISILSITGIALIKSKKEEN